MSLLQSIFSLRHSTPTVDPESHDLEEYDQAMTEKRGEAKLERDRTARIAEYLRCVQENRDDCRMGISWEELAEEGMDRG